MKMIFTEEAIHSMLNDYRKILSFNNFNFGDMIVEHLFTRTSEENYKIDVYIHQVPGEGAFDLARNLPLRIASGDFKLKEEEQEEIVVNYKFAYNWVTKQVLEFVNNKNDLIDFYQKLLEMSYDLEDEEADE